MATSVVHNDLGFDGGGNYPLLDPSQEVVRLTEEVENLQIQLDPSQEVVRLKEELSRVNECSSQKDKVIENLQIQLNQQTAEKWMVQHELSCLKEKFDDMLKSFGQTKREALVMLFNFMCHLATCCPQIQSFTIECHCYELKKVVDEFNIGEIKEKARMLYNQIQSRLSQITGNGGSLNDITKKCIEYINQCFTGINSLCTELLMADFIKQQLTTMVTFDQKLKLPCWSGARAVIDLHSTSCCSLWTVCVMLSHAFKEEVWISKRGIPIVAKATDMSEDQVKEHFCYMQTGDKKDTLKPLLEKKLIRRVSNEDIKPNQQEGDLAVFFSKLLHNLMIIQGEVIMLSVSRKGEGPNVTIGHCFPCVITADKRIVCGCDAIEFTNVSCLSAYVLNKGPFTKLIDPSH